MIKICAKCAALVFIAGFVMFSGAPSAQAEGPVKLVFSSHIGWEVNKLTEGNVCSVVLGDECQHGHASAEPGGFEYPESVAAASNGNIYVSDQGNHRVQELTASGEFVLMFGREVNASTHGDICTEEEIKTSSVKCKSGLSGAVAGGLAEPQGIAIDPSTQNVYVQDFANWRIDEYTSGGQFVLMIGKEVNETADNTAGASEIEKNLCTAVSKDPCKAGIQNISENTEKGAFNFEQDAGDLLAIGGGPEHLLYVGDGQRIQKFNAAGEWKSEIRLSSRVTAMAVDSKTENVYIVFGLGNVIREFNAAAEELKSFVVSPRESEGDHSIGIRGIALDPAGHLAVGASEAVGAELEQFGSLYEADDGHMITEFTIEGVANLNGIKGINFNDNGDLYVAVTSNHEISSYTPESVAQLITTGATCKVGPEKETSDTLNCILNGEVNPFDVDATDVSFEWGRTCALGLKTLVQSVEKTETFSPVNAVIEGLRPHEAFCYQLAGNDLNVQLPEQLTGERVSFFTPAVPPKVLGEPSVSFIKASSVVMFGELNPENALTQYFFEYGPGTVLESCPGVKKISCPGVSSTPVLEATLYGRMGATLEANGLQPGTTYQYRLAASNEGGESSPGIRGSFTTLPAAKVQAETGSAESITSTSAFVSGQVNPDGQLATYTFELGVYQGATSQYTTVLSGATGATTGLEFWSIPLTGLQPATTYVYRITIHSGYGMAEGSPVVFTTTALPITLQPPAPITILSVPKIQFPKPVSVCQRGFIKSKGKCIKSRRKIVKTKKHVRKGTIKKKK